MTAKKSRLGSLEGMFRPPDKHVPPVSDGKDVSAVSHGEPVLHANYDNAAPNVSPVSDGKDGLKKGRRKYDKAVLDEKAVSDEYKITVKLPSYLAHRVYDVMWTKRQEMRQVVQEALEAHIAGMKSLETAPDFYKEQIRKRGRRYKNSSHASAR